MHRKTYACVKIFTQLCMRCAVIALCTLTDGVLSTAAKWFYVENLAQHTLVCSKTNVNAGNLKCMYTCVDL